MTNLQLCVCRYRMCVCVVDNNGEWRPCGVGSYHEDDHLRETVVDDVESAEGSVGLSEQ